MSSVSPESPKPRILLVEDDQSIVLGLRINLAAEGYELVVAGDGVTGLRLAEEEQYDLVILDVMMPRMNGFDVLMRLRANGNEVPVLVLSARGTELDKVTGLDLGAEDYVTKPFSLAELLARVRTLLRRRRSGPGVGSSWGFDDVVVYPDRHEVVRGGESVTLTATEFKILALLHGERQRALHRDEILTAIWGPEHHGTARTIDNFIAQLRSKLEADPSAPKHLVTVRGVGYRFIE
jgi:DNA-binding response OmpR family regulator